MNTEQIFDEYIDIVEKNSKEYHKDYMKLINEVKNSTAMYKGEPIPFLYQPKFFSAEDVHRFKELSTTLFEILNKVIQRYIEVPEFRKKFQFSKLLEELIVVDHGYKANVPMARVDIFYHEDGDFKFCELNADGSSAMNEDRELSRILLEAKALKEMRGKYDFKPFELINKWVDESISIFKEFNKETEKPNIAIVDWEGGGTINEFKVFKQAYIDKGYRCEIVDPRKLKYENGKLYFEDMQIDMVYRRLVTREVIDRSEEIPDFIAACREGKVCIVGPIKSQIIHNKIIFKVLHDEDTKEYLSKEEIEYIKRHIPYTKEFKEDVNILKDAEHNKDKYILKPTDLYASRGVYAGRDFNEEQWNEKLKECWENDYLIQEYCVPYARKMVEFKDDKLNIVDYNNITGLYMYNEKLAGLYSRVGKNNIISGLHDCYTLPSIVANHKK